MPHTLTFVDACTQSHFHAMSLIHALGWRDTYRGHVPDDYLDREVTDTRWVPYFQEDYETGRCHGLLLYQGDTPVSCITYGPARVGPSPRQSSLVQFDSRGYEGWGEIVSFYTHPQHRGQGYGGLLFERAVQCLRELGHRDAFVFVLRENLAARRFYTRHGFAWDGTHADIPFPPDTMCVDLRYTKRLM